MKMPKTFKCTVCGRDFTIKKELDAHTEKAHAKKEPKKPEAKSK